MNFLLQSTVTHLPQCLRRSLHDASIQQNKLCHYHYHSVEKIFCTLLTDERKGRWFRRNQFLRQTVKESFFYKRHSERYLEHICAQEHDFSRIQYEFYYCLVSPCREYTYVGRGGRHNVRKNVSPIGTQQSSDVSSRAMSAAMYSAILSWGRVVFFFFFIRPFPIGIAIESDHM